MKFVFATHADSKQQIIDRMNQAIKKIKEMDEEELKEKLLTSDIKTVESSWDLKINKTK